MNGQRSVLPQRISCRAFVALALAVATALTACGGGSDGPSSDAQAKTAQADAQALAEQGKAIFRDDTFGNEAFWTDALKMNEVIAQSVSPQTALSVGLKVDAQALPASVVDAIKAGQVDLANPATTVTLLKLNAVVGVKGTVETVNGVDKLVRVGITCALCHSNVDDSFAPGIGKRLDGWPNRDLNAGAIVALSPSLTAEQKAIYNSWGKGKFDPRYNHDGLNNPVLIPPAYGLEGIHSVTYTGDGKEISYWNRYVAVTEMGGQGSFKEPSLHIDKVNGTQDLVTAKLPALQAYQLTLKAPSAPSGSFDASAAARGKVLFNGRANCATCHAGDLFTDANDKLHLPSESVAEEAYAARSVTKKYRTTPLRGAWQHAPYFHDGSAATLADVVNTYNNKKSLGLSSQESADLVEYLKSL